MAPPWKPLCLTSKGVMLTDNWSMASNDKGLPPAGRLDPMPKALLNEAPSTVTTELRKLPPPTMKPLAVLTPCGVRRRTS